MLCKNCSHHTYYYYTFSQYYEKKNTRPFLVDQAGRGQNPDPSPVTDDVLKHYTVNNSAVFMAMYLYLLTAIALT